MASTSDDPQYDLYQQVYCLSLISNCVGGKRDTAANLEQQLTTYIDELIQKITGSWQVSYGPCVYKTDESKYQNKVQGPENAWFAATSGSTCVVAIAGTASTSHAALEGDVLVGQMVDFDTWVSGWSANTIPLPTKAAPSGPTDTGRFISKGTADAVRNVLGEVGHAKPPRSMTVYQYLATLPDDFTVIFTGHSLGAAISPTAALGLTQQKLIGSKTVYVMPSAGASPGVQTFTDLYKAAFPPQEDHGSFRVFNPVFYNDYDVVPQAWSKDSKQARNFTNILRKIYDTAMPGAKGAIITGVATTESNLNANNPVYIPLQGVNFQAVKPDKTTYKELRDTIMHQHVAAYWTEFGLDDFFAAVEAVIKDNVTFGIPLSQDLREDAAED